MRADQALLSMATAMTLCTGAALAEDSFWQTVRLDDDPNFTISVPRVVANDYLPEASQRHRTLLFFMVSADDTHMQCALLRWPTVGSGYEELEGANFAGMSAKLASTARDLTCAGENPDHSNVTLEGSESMVREGFQAAECAASYTVARDVNPGAVDHSLTIATPKALYMFDCTVESSSQEDAVDSWQFVWADEIEYMHKSLHLPE